MLAYFLYYWSTCLSHHPLLPNHNGMLLTMLHYSSRMTVISWLWLLHHSVFCDHSVADLQGKAVTTSPVHSGSVSNIALRGGNCVYLKEDEEPYAMVDLGEEKLVENLYVRVPYCASTHTYLPVSARKCQSQSQTAPCLPRLVVSGWSGRLNNCTFRNKSISYVWLCLFKGRYLF